MTELRARIARSPRRTLLAWLTAGAVAALGVLWSAQGNNQAGSTMRLAENLPLVFRPPAAQPPVGLASDTHLDTAPPRATKGLDLVRGNWTYNCMECHTLLPARWHYDRPMVQHEDIHLDHGNNRFCLNCHHPKNRNAFVDYDGTEIPQAQVVQLCAKCHGTIYRDWEAGVHGRQNGHWNPSMGEQTKLRCIQCHDPHSPKFKEMKPLPPLTYPARAAGAAAAHAAHAP